MMKLYLMNMHKKNYEYEKRKYEMIIKNMLDNIKIKEEELNEFISTKNENMILKIKEQIIQLEEKINEYEENLKSVNIKLNNIVIDSKYTSVEVSDNFNQNIPIKYEGVVKRTEEKISGQNWYCISFLTEQDKSLVGIKISGCFNTEEQADSQSLSLRDINDSFNVHVGELYKWQPFNPDPDSLEAGEPEYANPQLNDTMKKKKENEKKAKLYNEYRKNEEIKKDIENLLNNRKKELTEDTHISSNILDVDEQIKNLEDKLKDYNLKTEEYIQQLGKPLQNKQ